MDIKQAIQGVIDEAKCEIDAEWEGDESAIGLRRRRAALMLESINRWADMAEAALAYVEWQIDNGADVPMDGATYMREREKLWHSFLVARGKAKGGE